MPIEGERWEKDMLGTEKVMFSVTDDPEAEAYAVDNAKLIRNAIGRPGSVNGVRLKECFCCMTLKSSGHPKTQRVTNAREVREITERAKTSDSVYMSRNSFVNGAVSFGSAPVFQTHNICIDVDWHGMSPEEACAAVNALCGELRDHRTRKGYGIPKPNAFCFTGRGVQIWFFLGHASAEMEFLAERIAEALCDRLERLLEDSPITYDGYEVDRQASLNRSRLYRVPGSFNPAARCVSQARVMDTSHRELTELAALMGVDRKISAGVEKPAAGASRTAEAGKKREGSRTGAREAALIALMEKAASTGCFMSREVLAHVFHSYLLSRGFGEEAAEEKVRALNDSFPVPLREREIKALIKCDRKHAYRYGEKAVFSKTGMPDAWRDEFFKRYPLREKSSGGGNGARDARSREIRVAWHNEIRRLAAEGLSIREIAEVTGRDQRTVRKYAGTPLEETAPARTDAAVPDFPDCGEKKPERDAEADRKRAITLYKHGFRTRKIAALMGITTEEAEDLLGGYLEYRKVRSRRKYVLWRLGMMKKELIRLVIDAADPPSLSTETNGLYEKLEELRARLRSMQPWNPTCVAALAEFNAANDEFEHFSDELRLFAMMRDINCPPPADRAIPRARRKGG